MTEKPGWVSPKYAVTGKHGHTVLPDTPFLQYGAEHGDETVLDQLFGYVLILQRICT